MRKELTLEEMEQKELELLTKQKEKTQGFIQTLTERKIGTSEEEVTRLEGLIALHTAHLQKLNDNDYKKSALEKFNKRKSINNTPEEV